MRRVVTVLLLIVSIFYFNDIFAQDADSVTVKKDIQNESSFINASSDSKPREISLGLPTSKLGTVMIFEDGLPVSYHIYHLYPYKSWHGGVSAESSANIGPMETAMRFNEINYFVYGINKTGNNERIKGSVSYTVGQYGQHKIDVNVNGPIKNGWQYSISTYQNLDPGSNHLSLTKYKDRHQFYKGVIAKDFSEDRGKMSFVYQYVNYFSITESYGLFNFVGDGSVTMVDGFNLGHDQYLPADKTGELIDFATGEMTKIDLDNNRDKSHHATFTFDYKFDNGLKLDVRSRYKYATTVSALRSLASLDNVSEEDGYTYSDGTSFAGTLQNRQVYTHNAHEYSWLNNIELSWNTSKVTWRTGTDIDISDRGDVISSAMSVQEAAANPRSLYFKGSAYYNYNTSAEYYSGTETLAAGYVNYDWKISKKWESEGFVRLGVKKLDGESANVIGSDNTNKRSSDFNLTKAHLTPVERLTPDWSAGANVSYKFNDRVIYNLEGITTNKYASLSDYAGTTTPSEDPTSTKLIRGGLTYNRSKFNITSQLIYISQNNTITKQSFSHILQKDVGDRAKGSSEMLLKSIVYSISSIGLTTDVNWNPDRHFSLHAQMMLRDPKYRNFLFTPTFSDGVTESYDFSGKHVTSISRVEMTLDPSYRIDKWRLWLTARYLSKQYINKTNSLFFAGRIETFGGVDYNLGHNLKLSLNIVNLLNQKGASGSINSADLIEDASLYKNYVMAGTYIRPFTVEFSVKADF